MTTEEADKILEGALDKIYEHFDSIQIVVSWNENKETFMVAKGCGNFFARKAMCQQFVSCDDAKVLAREIRENSHDL